MFLVETTSHSVSDEVSFEEGWDLSWLGSTLGLSVQTVFPVWNCADVHSRLGIFDDGLALCYAGDRVMAHCLQEAVAFLSADVP